MTYAQANFYFFKPETPLNLVLGDSNSEPFDVKTRHAPFKVKLAIIHTYSPELGGLS